VCSSDLENSILLFGNSRIEFSRHLETAFFQSTDVKKKYS